MNEYRIVLKYKRKAGDDLQGTQNKPSRWMLHAVIAGYALIMVSLLGTLYIQNNRIQAQIDRGTAYNEQLVELQKEGAALQSQMDFTMTDEYVEQVARDKLGLVKENELRFDPMP